MAIDFHLAGFPTLSQLHEPSNPYPDVNAGMDCVPTSIAAALTWFTGTPYYGDEIIDQVAQYGPSYQGGTAASAYEAYCAARGVQMLPIDGAPAALVPAIHTQLHQNRPVLVTVPGQWNNPATSGANPGDVTHVMVVCGDGPGEIEVMNPWTGAFEVYADSWFVVKLCYGQIWPMERATMQLSQVADFFEDAGNGQWRCKQTGQIILGGILQAYQSWPANGSQNGLTAFGLPQTGEMQVPGAPAGVVYQEFERGVIVWDQNHAYDTPPGVSAPAYAGHLSLVQPAPAPTPPTIVAPVPEWQSSIVAMQQELQALLDKANAPVSGGAEAEPEPDPALMEAQQHGADLEARLAKVQARLDRAIRMAKSIYLLIEQEVVHPDDQMTGPTVAVPVAAAPETQPLPVAAEPTPDAPPAEQTPASEPAPELPTSEAAPASDEQPAPEAASAAPEAQPDPSPEEILAAAPPAPAQAIDNGPEPEADPNAA